MILLAVSRNAERRLRSLDALAGMRRSRVHIVRFSARLCLGVQVSGRDRMSVANGPSGCHSQ
jgi:hypothetical protein